MPKPKPKRPAAPVASKHPIITYYEMGVAAAHARRLAKMLAEWATRLEQGDFDAAGAESTSDAVYRMMAAARGCDVVTLARMELVQLIEEHAQRVAQGAETIDDAVSGSLLRYRDRHPMFVVNIDKPLLAAALDAWARDHNKWRPTLEVLRSAGLAGVLQPRSLGTLFGAWKKEPF